MQAWSQLAQSYIPLPLTSQLINPIPCSTPISLAMRNYTDEEGIVTVRNHSNKNRINQQRASPPIPNYWLKLPREIIIMILQKVGLFNILLSAQLVCTQWRELICTDPSMWATIRVDWISFRTPRILIYNKPHVENMIRWAVDQSCGSLFYLDSEIFMSEELLSYMFERCNRIRRLRIPMCFIEELLESLTSGLPLLEDFEIVYNFKLSFEAIETLGRYCPKLSLLKIHVHGNEEAKTIARSMPQLRHICLSGKSFVTDVGVEALLDGCPHLKSLDIRGCYFFDIVGAFQMTKKLPLTPTQWRDVLDDPSTWSTICLARFFIDKSFDLFEYEYMIRRAVDNSCGGLVDLDFGNYIFRDVFEYIVERCTRIRRLHGYMLYGAPEEAVRTTLARLPLLEDLSLHYQCRLLSPETIETLMRCCPRLTSLEIPIYDNDEAETLARSFPQLRHLKPFNADELTDAGVDAILNGCPNLESLDLRECDFVTLYGTLWIRCAQKIKYFQRPSTLDCRYYYRWSYCGSREYQKYEDDIDYNQFLEEDLYDVDYTIHRREEYWSRREKARSKETHTQQLRRVKGNKNRPNSNTRDPKARRISKSRKDSRREVKKEFVHWNKLATGPCTVKKMVLESFAG